MTTRIRTSLLAATLLLACSSEPKVAPSASTPTAQADAAKADAPSAARTKNGVGSEPLRNAKPSLSALGQAVVEGLAAKDPRALTAVTVPQVEYAKRLFGAVSDPATRPKGPQVAWAEHDRRSRAGLAAALTEHGGKGYTFVSLESTAKREQGGVVLHDQPKLTVKDTEGLSHELPILGAVVEHPESQTFSVLSYGR